MADIDLRLGDCLEILPTLANNSVDAVITDIPYGTTACSWDEVIPFEPMWKEIKRITNVFITTASQPFTSKLVMSNLDWFKHEWIWEKDCPSNGLMANKSPLKYHENILVFCRNSPTYNPIMWDAGFLSHKRGKSTTAFMGQASVTPGTCRGKTDRFPKSIVKINTTKHNSNEGKNHPTQKPIALYEYLIKTYTNMGDMVADISMGSGTTGVACVQTGRNFIGIDIEPKYYEIAQKRIAEAQLQIRMEI